jgi:hypothetical protein
MGFKDRGLKKYRIVSMTPELGAGLKKMEYVPMPELDEQQLEHLDQAICEAMDFNNEVSITYFNNHRYELIVGHIHYFEPIIKSIRIVHKFQEWFEIKISYIIEYSMIKG